MEPEALLEAIASKQLKQNSTSCCGLGHLLLVITEDFLDLSLFFLIECGSLEAPDLEDLIIVLEVARVQLQ